jgi:hypothetical protein
MMATRPAQAKVLRWRDGDGNPVKVKPTIVRTLPADYSVTYEAVYEVRTCRACDGTGVEPT